MNRMLSLEGPFHLPSSRLTPQEWVIYHQEVHRYFVGPRETRIPTFLSQLTEKVCATRFSLEQLRVAFDLHPEGFRRFRETLSTEQTGLDGPDPEGHLVHLVDNYFSRIDWREQDILEMILEFLTACPETCGKSLKDDLVQFGKLRQESRSDYDRALQGLISETRGSVMGLMQAVHALQNHPDRFSVLDETLIRLLVQALACTLGLPPDTVKSSEPLPEEPARLWERLFEEARRKWEEKGITVPLKLFEQASLFLLESLPIESGGHARFVRYLIEQKEPYRRLAATCYAPFSVRCERLSEEMERYNRLPEHATHPVRYGEEEKRFFLYGFFLRPDVVASIVEREHRKDLYRVISGLGARAYLPRTLHECQNVFGYITPEAFQKIVETLGSDPVDVIRVIASYKQYSVDPGGDIIIYLCKGTACFLRGQPELSRRLASEIRAQEGEVGRHGIQFIEMDCFGVCHLAPVIKAGDVFLGGKTPEDIPRLLEQLLKGPTYENRLSFLRRIQKFLSPGHRSEPLKEVRIVSVIDGKEKTSPPESRLRDHYLQIDASGRVWASNNGTRQDLGRLVPQSLAFTYASPDGTEQVGCLILDENRQIRQLIHFSAPFPEKELHQTIKPQARVADGVVVVDRTGDPLRLGTYAANAVAVEQEEGRYGLIVLTGPPDVPPPEKEEGFATEQEHAEVEEFLRAQDRLVLGFAAEADPDRIESYMACGGYEAVYRVLGLRREAAWEPRDIVIEISEANLRGRGGAGFPTGRKWDAVRLAKCVIEENDANKDPFKLIVANGDEGDPGAFMDRTLIQERPHQVIEGMILAALAVGARYGVIYVRKEYEDAVRRLEHALFQARRKGFLGKNIFGVPDLHFDLEIRLGAGAFVAGEKRAIMRAIEGEPAEPTLKSISNTVRGLWGKPTLLNNVETFANVPLIIQHGAKWFAEQGTERSGGSKIFSVAGIVKRTGLVEVTFGRTLSDIIRICGGIREGKQLAGVQIGGPSGAILSLTGVRSYLLHTPLDFDTFDQVGAMLGSGGLVFIGEDDDVVRLARHFTDWLSEESCGQCPPCLQGTVSLGRTLDAVLQGEGTADHIHALWTKSDAIKAGSQCGLGMTSANPVTSALRFFPHAFLHYLLLNPRLNRPELFRSLEALRLLTRENIEAIRGRRRRIEGYSFTLKKHLLRNLVTELERLDRYRSPRLQRTNCFLDLLQVPAHEVGTRDVTLECSPETMEQHRLYLHDQVYETALSEGVRA